MEQKRILVVGAGISGILSISHLKAEGMEPICYERSDKFGGTWCYRTETRYGQASIMPTTIINQSKEMGALSNFPPRKEFPNYMKHTELYQYFTEYAKHNDCERHVHYNMEVIHVKKATDYEQTGRWAVTTKNLTTGQVIKETFDGVFAATGHINMPFMPNFPGQEMFSGKIMHTHSLKNIEAFTDKVVVIVGIGCSALDAAVEISRVAKQVYLSSRSGGFVWNRVGRNGYPVDVLLLRRCFTQLLAFLPINLISWYLETFYIDVSFDHRFYYKKPKYHIMSKEPMINDHIGSKLLCGSVIQKGDILKFNENGVLFDGENSFTKVDSVVMATGYTWGFPYLEDGTIKVKDEIIYLYKCMYPPHLSHPTLAIIAFLYPYGPGFPLVELQVRWAACILAGKGRLPSEDIMVNDIIQRHEENVKRYCPGEKMSIRVDFVQYSDEIAEQIGVKPNLMKYLFTDILLFLRLLFGPSVPYQYRLEGHGKWEGAREAIMTVDERIYFPLSRKKPTKRFFRHILDYILNMIPFNIFIWE